ncbi:MAG: ribonuclease P protein component [Microthrixaceae bacterium]
MTTALGREHDASSRPTLWHISERSTFAAFRQDGHRAHRGPLTVTWLPPRDAASDPPRVAFAIGRSVGNAVTRNRVRRRLRAALRELQNSGRLPQGAYLVGGRAEAATLPWTDLVATLDLAVEAACASGPPR